MNIKELLAKIAKGETLTDEEKTFIAGYDPDKVANSTAAGARKVAEAKLKEKEAELQQMQTDIEALRAEADDKANANKPEIEKLTRALETLKKQVADKDAAFAKLDQEKRQMIRNGKIGKIMAGLKFVDGLDPEFPHMALERALSAIKDEDLEAEDLIKPIVDRFTASNKAIMADTSGHGSGNPPKDGADTQRGLTMTKINSMSPEEFLKQKDAIWAAEQKGTLH